MLPRNAICYLPFQLASKFNTEIYENCSTSDSVLVSLPEFRPWTQWGLPYWPRLLMVSLELHKPVDGGRGAVEARIEAPRGGGGVMSMLSGRRH